MGMLDGKAVAITGAARGLGRAHAVAAADAGARVVVNDVDAEGVRAVAEAIRRRGGQAVAHVGSVSDYDASAELVQVCRETFGVIDGLVSNAAILHRSSPTDEDETRLRRIVDVNILGSLFCAIHAFNAMLDQGGGAIVNTTSGAHLGMPDLTAYGTTKGAVASLTYNLALEGYRHGVRVNALSPVAQTAMAAGLGALPDGRERPQPEAIAPAVVFLLSDRAATITGQVLRFDSWSLSFMELPNFRTKRVTSEAWSAEEIARVYETELLGERRSVGMAADITFDASGADGR
jgi:NAD(P)-dependent dehydrogenase (short-subunit alcohol dehydrogenase family)